MSDKMINLFGEDMTEKQQRAVELHYQIKADGERAATALVDFSKGLKRMRDERLYTELGYEAFEDYCENAVGLKQRQAYTYIQALERLGSSVLQSTAKIGITKLQLLTEIPPTQRTEFLEENEVESMSAREMKELVEKLTAAEEQISLLTDEREERIAEADDAEYLKRDIKLKTEKIDELEYDMSLLSQQIKELREKPEQVAVAEPSEEDIRKAADKLVKKALKQAEDEKKQAVVSAKNEVAKEYKESIALLDKEKAAAVERLNEMEKQAKLTANPVVMKFGFYFDELQKNYNEMAGIIAGADEETAQKLKGALVNLLQKLSDEAGGQ